MYRNGDRVRVTDLNGDREGFVTRTDIKNGEPIVLMDDGSWVYVRDIVEMTGTKRLAAVFQPQAWVNDYAVDIDGAVEFDATEALLGRDLDYIHRYAECSYDSDALADDLPERQQHDGPFEVECNVWEWLEENGVPQKQTMTQTDLDRLREGYGVTPHTRAGLEALYAAEDETLDEALSNDPLAGYLNDEWVECSNCGHADTVAEFTPTDGRPDEFGCPKCGSSNCHRAD